MPMSNKNQLTLLVAVLLCLGIGITLYKVLFLGFALSPSERATVWTLETEISFVADRGPVEVSLNLPDNLKDLVVVDVVDNNPGYTYFVKEVDGVRRGIWLNDNAAGPQKIYQRLNVYRLDTKAKGGRDVDPSEIASKVMPLSGAAEMLADSLIISAGEKGLDSLSMARELLRLLNAPENNTMASSLLEMKDDFGGPLELARSLLLHAGVNSRVVRGVFLNETAQRNTVKSYLEVRNDNKWFMLDPLVAEIVNFDDFLLWQVNAESLLEVVGGHDSNVSFSSVEDSVKANRVAIESEFGKTPLVDFSIYSLPVHAQNSFKLLLLIPLGALVVVIMRNLVGIRTSGTFLPILIALTFLQTSLLVGLALFVLIVALGLVLRSYLNRLNLLLVPRISAVLVFVIVIYLAISVISHKMGSDIGLLVTFFPMIIISWTIERMSILWEEEGFYEVFIQGGGSLLTASLIYLVISNRLVGHLTYSFPELLLVVLVIILMLGSYSGYRLSELRRFEPMGRE